VGAAFGVDVAVLCVAADEGPMPQTAEHLDVLRLLGVTRGGVALTKSDLLPARGPDHRELLLLELRELLAGSFLEKAPIVEVSARTGQGLRELIEAIALSVKEGIEEPRSEQGPLFLPLDRAFAVKGFGTVVTGTLFSGSLGSGDEVDLVGSGARIRAARVRGVQVHGGTVDRARAGLRLGAKVAALSGLRFLVRGELGKPIDGKAPAPGRFTAASRAHASTLGGGRILAVGSRKRRKRESDVRALQALSGDDALAQ